LLIQLSIVIIGAQTPRGDQTPSRMMPQTPGHDAWNVNSIATPRHVPNDNYTANTSTSSAAAGAAGSASGNGNDPWGSSGGFATSGSGTLNSSFFILAHTVCMHTTVVLTLWLTLTAAQW
jgi:hypothetical protein